MCRHNFRDLPPELLFNILILLDPKDLIRCMCVSKAWNASICNQRFIKLHHQRSIKTNSSRIILLNPFEPSDPLMEILSLTLYDDDTFRTAVEIPAQPFKQPNSILGYSNGLVCICNLDIDKTDFALWNPSIRKWKKIPFTTSELQQPSQTNEENKVHYHYGFGYDSANDDYKVVKIVQFYSKNLACTHAEVNVYSLKSNSWKMIQSMPLNGFQLQSDAVFLNNALSWKMEGGGGDRCTILTLDLASEKYRMFPFPVYWNDNFLGLLGGYLCVYNRNWDHALLRHDVWIMKEYEVTESWTLLFSLDESILPLDFRFITPLVFSKNGEMVLLEIDCYQLFWFDLEKHSAEEVEIPGLTDLFEATICEGFGSLRLLDGDPLTVGRQQQ